MPLFTDEITTLESPIDVMYLMHKVYMVHSELVESLAERAQEGGDLSEFQVNLDVWLKHLLYHAQTEDDYMTGPLKDKQLQDGRYPLRDNESEHDELRELGGSVLGSIEKDKAEVARILEEEDKEHQKLMTSVEDVQAATKDVVIGERYGQSRSRRHLYASVMALRVNEFDHFENEEAFVLPIVKEQMSYDEELELARKLLIEDSAENPRWVIDLILSALEGTEKELLQALDDKFHALA